MVELSRIYQPWAKDALETDLMIETALTERNQRWFNSVIAHGGVNPTLAESRPD